MIRYAGILFIVCVSICFYIFRKKYSQKAIRIIPLYILFSLAPIGIWFINQYNNLNKVGGKKFLFDFDLIKNVFQTILQEVRIIQGWIPYSGIYSAEITNKAILFFFSALFSISIALGVTTSIKNKNIDGSRPLLLFQICLIFSSAYVLFIGFTHNLTIPSIDIIDRMVAPIYPFLLLILIFGFEIFWKDKSKWLLGSILLIVALFSTRFYMLSTLNSVDELHDNGKGYTSRQFRESEFLEKLVSLPTDQPMVSNSAAFVLFNTNRFPLPVEQFHNRPFGSGDAYGEKSFREREAALIILFPEFHNYYGKNSDQLLKSLTAGLRVDFLDEIGGIYYYPEKPIPQ